MKITCRIEEVEISIEDSDSDDPCSFRWEDQRKHALAILKECADAAMALHRASKENSLSTALPEPSEEVLLCE